MQRIVGFVMLACVALACNPSASQSSAADGDKEKSKSKSKGVVVDFDGAKSTTPGDWKEEAPENRMRYMQFRLPKKGDDKEDANLVIYKGVGGDSKANIERWKGQFSPPEGKKIDDVATVKEFKIDGHPATLLDVHGTYKFKKQPFNPRAKVFPKANFRMLAVYYKGPKDLYQIKLTGPAKTIEAYKKGFDEWLKNFK